MSTGAPSAHVPLKETLSSIRKKDLLQAAVTISGLAHQETHKKQVRAVLSHFQNFLTSLPVTFRHLPLPTLAVLWLQDNLRNNAKIKRITTIHQKARLLQSAFPGQPILRAPILLLYLKGLGRLQPTSPRNLPTASWPQCLRFVRLARETPWTLAAATLIVKGAARWSDIRTWIGKNGVLITGSLSQAAIISQDRPVSISPPRSRDRSHSRQQNREKDIASEFVSLVEGPTLSLSILCQDFSAQDAGTQEVCGSAELFGVQESKSPSSCAKETDRRCCSLVGSQKRLLIDTQIRSESGSGRNGEETHHDILNLTSTARLGLDLTKNRALEYLKMEQLPKLPPIPIPVGAYTTPLMDEQSIPLLPTSYRSCMRLSQFALPAEGANLNVPQVPQRG